MKMQKNLFIPIKITQKKIGYKDRIQRSDTKIDTKIQSLLNRFDILLDTVVI